MSAATHSEVAPENRHDGTVAPELDLKAGRRKVARSRGVLSGILLMLLGAWAALVPFIGPYFDFGIEPNSGDAWHWTSGRGLYELLPGGVTFLAGLVLLVSASRALTVLMAWLAALAGAWLVVGTTLDLVFKVGSGTPPNGTGTNKLVALTLLYFLATGVAIALIAGIALGRLSVHSVRDVRAAERQAEADAAAAADARRIEAERLEAQRVEAQRADTRHEDTRHADTRHEDTRRADTRHEDTRHEDTRHADTRDAQTQRVESEHRRDHDDAPTAVHPRTDDGYAAPSAGPYEQNQGRAADQRTSEYPVEGGAHATDHTAEHATGNPTPPEPGGVGQYRYPADDTPAAPRDERDR